MMDILCNLVSVLIMFGMFNLNNFFLLENKDINKIGMVVGGILFSFTIFMIFPIKIIGQLVILILVSYINTKEFKKSISAVMFQYLVLMLIDVSLSLIFLSFDLIISNNILVSLVITIVELGLLWWLVRRRILLRFWMAIKDKFNEYMGIVLFLMLVYVYIDIVIEYEIINIIVIGVSVLLFSCILIKKIIDKNQLEILIKNTNKYIEDCENLMQRQMVNQHEYKNILLCIKNMVIKDKEIDKFVNSVLDDEEKTINYGVLREVQKLRISSLKAILYCKLLSCREKDIQYVLNISSTINYKKIDKLEIKIIKDMTMILGVLLDNAMEACVETESKSMGVYIYEEEGDMVIQVSNTFRGRINVDLLFKKGYSTKGNSHGYGLSLVKKIVKENKRLSIKSEINDDVFIQYLRLVLNDTKNRG